MKTRSCLLITLLLLMCTSTPAQTYDNDSLEDQITAIGVVHNLAFVPSLSPEPVSSIVGGSTTYATNLGLKYVPPVLRPPAARAHIPNSADQCSFVFAINGDAVKTRQDYLGLLQSFEDDFDWSSALGQPEIYHVNTDVDVSVFRGDERLSGTVSVPIGSHNLRWHGQTLVTPILDYPPWHLLLAELVEAGARKAVIGLRTPAARRATMQAMIELFIELGIEGATFGVDWFILDGIPTPANGWEVVNNQVQDFKVLDLVPPSFQVLVDRFTVEATQVGGEYLRDHISELRDGFTVTDNCGRRAIVNYAGPSFLPVGETTNITWTARDLGPRTLEGGFNTTQFTQQIFVQDTLPPIVVPPAGRVIESTTATSVNVGSPLVFDLADVRPSITNDAPALFSPDTRTLVTWSAEDASGNATTANQWVTLKAPGTNTRPSALPQATSALTYDPTVIELQGIDTDLLSGRYDQLAFSLVQQPANGFFVAPLFPYFIEDHRVENEFGMTRPELSTYLSEQCAADPNNFVVPVDYVYEPRYITVDDDGIAYVADRYQYCHRQSGQVLADNRIARFTKDSDGELEFDAQYVTGNNSPNSLNIGQDGYVYFKGTRVDSSTATVRGCDPLLSDCAVYRVAIDTSLNNSDNLFPRGEPASVAVDANGVMYVTDGRQALVAYDLLDVSNNYPAVLGNIADVGELASSGTPFKDLAIDSDGNLYLSDYTLDRVYKFSASSAVRHDDGSIDFTPGDLIGWMGRCETNLTTARACDEVEERSYGYSCTNESCGVTETAGSAPGQFNQPQGIAVTSNDVLYVTDHQNLRVQRFSPEGYFAGEAESECDGSCFVLGDFGNPEDVSANQQFFYVLDRDRDLLHVFETTPITDFDDDTQQPTQTARVTYQSDENFQGSDTFSFVVSDGLETSNAAIVTVNVTRNFRPPIAEEGMVFEGDEDTPIDIALRAFDPDRDDQPNLVYTIETQPANGEIRGSSPDFSYHPNPDFFGTDTFTFSVSDGGMESETVAATIEVAPVNDPPIAAFGEMATGYGAGFPVRIEATLNDVDLSDRHVYGIDTGPGNPFLTGMALPPGEVAGDGEPTFIQSADGTGVLVHEQTFFSYGTRQLRVCFSDLPGVSSLASCDDPNVTAAATHIAEIEPRVSKAVVMIDTAPTEEGEGGANYLLPIMDGELFDLLFVVHNLEPNDVGNPLEATGVTFTARLGDGLAMGSAGIIGISGNASGVSCSTAAQQLDCTIEAIPIGGSARVAIQLGGNGRIAADTYVPVVAVTASSESDHNVMVGNSRSYTLTMNPDFDADGDGVVNRDDAFPGDPTETSDFDADGIGDNVDQDDDNDGMPDSWEERFGFDRLSAADATADSDNDQLTNAEEYERGTRPDAADSDRDERGDVSDNCPVTYNSAQFDLDADGIGDACDPDTFAAVVALGEIGGDAGPDYAVLRTVAGQFDAFIKDGRSNESIAADRIRLGDAGERGLRSVATASTSLLALATAANGEVLLTGHNLTSGARQFEQSVFDSGWRPVSMTVVGSEAWIVATNDNETAELRRFDAANGNAIGAIGLGSDELPEAIAASVSGNEVFVLGTNRRSGDWQVAVRRVSDGTLLATSVVAGADTLVARLAAMTSGFAVAAQGGSGGVTLSTWSDDGSPNGSADVLDAGGALVGLSADPSAPESVVVIAATPDGALAIRAFSTTDGAEEASLDRGGDGYAFRGHVIAAAGGGSDVGVLLADASNAVQVELWETQGGNVRVITAESVSPPPPPPPPTPTPPPADSGGSGGGGNGLGLLLLLLARQLARAAANRGMDAPFSSESAGGVETKRDRVARALNRRVRLATG